MLNVSITYGFDCCVRELLLRSVRCLVNKKLTGAEVMILVTVAAFVFNFFSGGI